MLAFIPTTLSLLIIAELASAFDPTTDQQNCMQTCMADAPASGCAGTDFTCLCASSSFGSTVEGCWTTTCNISSGDAGDAFTAQCQALTSFGGGGIPGDPGPLPTDGSSSSSAPPPGSSSPSNPLPTGGSSKSNSPSAGGSSGSVTPPVGGSNTPSTTSTPSTSSTPPSAKSGNNSKKSAGPIGGAAGALVGLVVSSVVLLA
ncbi:hypothetical protein B0H19DRAFT_1378774 [Mycena capillaripes]|nr:hypothetical protein B0H19DRAFT_1378774 [Mycena capillaripes]